jgi:hypothetical protein
VFLQHFGNRASGNPVIQVSQSTLYPGISPTGILFGQACDRLCLLAADPAGECGQEKLEMDNFTHSGSISEVW